ncbi:hypothetical protein BH09PSE6_BH09PSE6_13270 [soil metagenome]
MSGPDSPSAAAPAGTIASHPIRIARPLRVAPTDALDFNTLSVDLVAVACLQVPDVLFEFDSSFPAPTIASMLGQIPSLRERHRSELNGLPPLSVFGHADPIGDDEYNKILSGRRAMAIYGALTHDVPLWEFLFDHPHGGDDWKAADVMAVMRTAVPGSADMTRQQLIEGYLRTLSGEAIGKDQFIGRGRDPKGKADFQGCGEFNPLRLLSIDESRTLSRVAKHEQNLPNRRVIVFMFRPGTRIDTARWPCPTALDATAACRKRFFGPPRTGEIRRTATAARREFADASDTFACRFYDRIARLSPCELPLRASLFEYGLESGKGFAWSDKARLRIFSVDGSHSKTFDMTQGDTAGTHRVFLFPGPRPGLEYRGQIVDGKVTFELFDPVELFRIQDPSDSLNTLPMPEPAVPNELAPLPPGPPIPFAGPVDDVPGDIVEFAVDPQGPAPDSP